MKLLWDVKRILCEFGVTYMIWGGKKLLKSSVDKS